MKKLFFLLLALIACLTIQAERVIEQEALQKAQNFMQGKKFKTNNLRRAPSLDVSNNAYYVFNVENDNGFVIVAGDDRMPDILGYSSKGSLNIDNIPDGLKWLLGYYEEIAKHISNNSHRTARSHRTERAPISPLITTIWGQDYPYNLQCPYIGSSQCITGCVATAMAQIMNYCQWPEKATTSIKSYTTYSNKINLPELEPTTFNWNYMNVLEMSKLMRYCGQAIEMDYGLNSSGTFSENAAYTLVQNFGYDSSVHTVYQKDYTDENWESLMYEELVAKRAVLFSGTRASGDLGHAFIIHGYDAGRFYINWGWEGIDDGYFMLTGLTPDGDDYSYYQSAIIGIQPPGGVKNESKHPIISDSQISCNGVYDHYHWRRADGSFMEIKSFITLKSTVINQPVQIGLGLYNEEGLQKVLNVDLHSFTENENYVYEPIITIDKRIPDGDYYIYPISRKSDEEEWVQDTRSDVNCLWVSIHDNLRKILVYERRPNIYTTQRHRRNYVAICNIDGIYYDIYNEVGKNCAMVIPANGGYKGDIFIPDHITYEGVDYFIDEANRLSFDDCQELTAISTSMPNAPIISDCPRLTKVDFREGVKNFSKLYGCALLEQLVFPQSVETVEFLIGMCPKLKTLRFYNQERLTFKNWNTYWYLWNTNNITDIYFHQTTPPNLLEQERDVEPISGVTIHIPKGTLEVYKSSIWKNFELKDDISIEYGGNKIYWSYCQSTIPPKGRSLELMDERGLDREFAIHIPAELISAYKGCKITAIQFFALWNDMGMADYVFVTKPGVDYLSKQSAEPKRYSWVTTQLSTPVSIDGDDLYVGIGRRDNLEISFSADNFEVDKDILCMRTMNPNNKVMGNDKPIGKWESAQKTSPVCLRFLIEGEDLPYDLHINGVRTEGNNLYATIFSRTPDYVDSFTLNWELGNGEKGSQAITSDLVPNGQGEYTIDLPANLKGFNHNIQLEIASINGKPDAIPENSNKAYIIELQPETTYPRVAVMESLTGTWCGNSPRGTVAMQLLKQKYGDRYIPIAIHYANEHVSDIMYLSEYDCPVVASSTVPICTINRGKWVDPYTGTSGVPYQGIIDDMDAIMNQKAPAALGVETNWSDVEKTSIEITTSTIIGGDEDHLPYQLGYVLLEDGLHGDGEEWNQSNGFHNWAGGVWNDPNLMPYVDMPEQLTNVKYNHVPVAAWGSFKGLEGTVPESVIGGEIYNHTFKANILGNTHIQDKNNLSVVVLLLNKNTGAIISATQCKVGESTGIPAPTEKITITANSYTRTYGDANPTFGYTFSNNDTFNGEPEITCQATKTSPVGTYPIIIKKGTLSGSEYTYINGTLTITKAPLTITAKSYTIKQGDNLPTFEAEFSGFKNNETEDVLITKPSVTCEANMTSKPGEYQIKVSGAEANNYAITYIDGILVVTNPKPGDITGSGSVDVQDATLAINYILGFISDEYNYSVADMNGDGDVDVFDVTAIINIILSDSPQAAAKRRSDLYKNESIQLTQTGNGALFSIENADRFTSLQFDISLSEGIELQGIDLKSIAGHNARFAKIGNNRFRVIVISMNSMPFPTTDNLKLGLILSRNNDGNVIVDNVIFVTPEGKASSFNGNTLTMVTGIQSVTDEQSEHIYDLSGQKLDKKNRRFAKGIYIINNKKVVNK